MKSTRYLLIASGALGSSILAFGGCSSAGNSGAQGNTAQGSDQVQNALDQMAPFACRINRNTCKRAIRQCVENSCQSEIDDLVSAPWFSATQRDAVHALQQCAKEECSNACMGSDGGVGGAPGADAGTGGAMSTGGMSADAGPPAAGGMSADAGPPGAGGAMSTGGAGGATGTGGATSTGGTCNGGATSTGGAAATGGATSTGGATGTGGAAATGGATSTGGASAAGGMAGAGGTSSTGVDLSGTWISHVQTSGTLTAPVVGTTSANIDIVLRLLVAQSASSVTGTLQICRLNPVTTPNASSLQVTFTPAVLATLKTDITEPGFTAMVGQPVPLPDVTILTGVDASGNPVDSDMDGNPGDTIPANVGGILQLNAYTGLTIKTSLTGTLTDANTIDGTASFSSTGTVFGSNNPILTSGNINVTPSSTAVPFTATKLTGDVPCSDVLAQF